MIRRFGSSDQAPWLLPVLVSGALVGGFLVLLTMWFAGDWPTDVPGLFDYPSAFLGDSVLLPIAAGLLAFGVRSLPRVETERMTAVLAGFVVAVAAGITQILWLADDSPTVNWTLPEAHSFNAAGYWHAIYLIITAAVLGVLTALLARRMHGALRSGHVSIVERLLKSSGSYYVLACIVAYLTLAVHDSPATTLASQTSLVAIATALVLIVLLATLILRFHVRFLLRPLAVGSLAAVSLYLVMTAPWTAEHLAVVGTAAAVLSGVGAAMIALVPGTGIEDKYNLYRPALLLTPLAGTILAISLPAIWSYAAAASVERSWRDLVLWSMAYVAFLAVVPAIFVNAMRLKWLLQSLNVTAVFASLGAIPLTASILLSWENSDDFALFAAVAVAALIIWVLFPTLWSRFEVVIKYENQAREDGIGRSLSSAQRIASGATLIMLAVAGLAAFFAIFAFTLAIAAGRQYVDDNGAHPKVIVLLVGGSVLLAVVACLAVLRSRAAVSGVSVTAPALVTVWPAVLLWAGVPERHPLSLPGIVGGVLLAAWSANSGLNNVTLLRGRRLDTLRLVYVLAIALSGFVSGYFSLTAALGGSRSDVYTWFAGIATGGAVLLTHGALSAAGGVLVAPSKIIDTKQSLWLILVQDAALVTLLFLIALVVPATTLLHLSHDLGLPDRLFSTFAICFPFITCFVFIFVQIMKANLQHLFSEIGERATDLSSLRAIVDSEKSVLRRNAVLLKAAGGRLDGLDQDRFARVLNAHIRNQNALAISVAVISLVGIASLLVGAKGTFSVFDLRETA